MEKYFKYASILVLVLGILGFVLAVIVIESKTGGAIIIEIESGAVRDRNISDFYPAFLALILAVIRIICGGIGLKLIDMLDYSRKWFVMVIIMNVLHVGIAVVYMITKPEFSSVVMLVIAVMCLVMLEKYRRYMNEITNTKAE